MGNPVHNYTENSCSCENKIGFYDPVTQLQPNSGKTRTHSTGYFCLVTLLLKFERLQQ